MPDTDSLYRALIATITENVRPIVRAEERAKMERERDSRVGKRLLNRELAALKLCVSERQLDRLKRADPRFPRARYNRGSRTPYWLESELDAFLDGMAKLPS